MLNLWYSEFYEEDAKFSIKVDKHLYSEITKFQRIDFFESNTFGKIFTLDGLIMVTEKDEFIYHDMICHPAFATNPNIKKVLIIGGGDGGTAREAARYKHIQLIDMVEIDERVVRLCQKYLPLTSSQLENDERINLYFEDGINFVQNSKDNFYDLILVDSTDPIGPGEGLFSMNFYQNCYRILNENGILINQHESPYYKSYSKEMQRSNNKIKQIFPISKVYDFHMPTYPSGHWLFGFASKKFDPIKDFDRARWESFGITTKYYNTDVHRASFALPTYVKELLS